MPYLLKPSLQFHALSSCHNNKLYTYYDPLYTFKHSPSNHITKFSIQSNLSCLPLYHTVRLILLPIKADFWPEKTLKPVFDTNSSYQFYDVQQVGFLTSDNNNHEPRKTWFHNNDDGIFSQRLNVNLMDSTEYTTPNVNDILSKISKMEALKDFQNIWALYAGVYSECEYTKELKDCGTITITPHISISSILLYKNPRSSRCDSTILNNCMPQYKETTLSLNTTFTSVDRAHPFFIKASVKNRQTYKKPFPCILTIALLPFGLWGKDNLWFQRAIITSGLHIEDKWIISHNHSCFTFHTKINSCDHIETPLLPQYVQENEISWLLFTGITGLASDKHLICELSTEVLIYTHIHNAIISQM